MRFVVRAPATTLRVAFYVDGRRRFVDHAAPWRYRRTGYLDVRRMKPGRHRLGVRAWTRNGRLLSRTTTISARPAEPPLVEAGFENGLQGWNTGGAGDAVPSVVSDLVRDGSESARVVLTGAQSRSELILAAPGSSDVFEFREGDAYYYGFSFYIVSMRWGRPGAHNIIWQLHQRGTGNTGSPPMALALADDQGHRGLWSQSTAMNGDRFLRSIDLHRWYDVNMRFTVSSQAKGSYDLYLDGQLIDANSGANTLVPGNTACMIQTGLYRNGGVLQGTSEIRLDAARLGTTFEQVQPR